MVSRYKYGRPLEIPLVDDPPIVRLKLFNLTYPTLRRRLCELKEKWHQHIYWKVVVSIPGKLYTCFNILIKLLYLLLNESKKDSKSVRTVKWHGP